MMHLRASTGNLHGAPHGDSSLSGWPAGITLSQSRVGVCRLGGSTSVMLVTFRMMGSSKGWRS